MTHLYHGHLVKLDESYFELWEAGNTVTSRRVAVFSRVSHRNKDMRQPLGRDKPSSEFQSTNSAEQSHGAGVSFREGCMICIQHFREWTQVPK